MNKLFTKVATGALSLALAIGVYVAIGTTGSVPAKAAEEVSNIITFGGGKNVSSYTSSFDETDNVGVNWTISNFNNNKNSSTWSSNVEGAKNYIKCGNKGAASVATIYNNSALNSTVFTKVDLYITALTSNYFNNIKVYGGSSSGTSEIELASTTSVSPSTTTPTSLIISTPTAYSFYTIAFDTQQGKSNGIVTLDKVCWYKDSTPVQTYTVSFDANGGTGTMNDVSDVLGNYTLPANSFTAPTNKAFAGWKAENTGDLIAAGETYNVTGDVTFYAQWADVFTVTYNAGTNGSGSYVHSNQPSGEYTLLGFADLTGISPASGYSFLNYTVNGVKKNPGETITLSASTSITVNFEVTPLETTYDFVTNFTTYASSGWTNSYSTHEGIDGKTDLGGVYAATVDLYFASKQTGTITDMPVFKAASGTKVLQFTLNDTDYKIKEVVVTFTQWGSKTPTVALYKGNDITGTPLDTAKIGTKNTLNVSDLNGLDFAIGYSDDSTPNVQSGISSIYITLVKLESFGTLDHISVTSLPKTFYHVGESYSSEGLTVVAYDSADEDVANFKVVTDSSDLTILIDEGHEFSENDVPGFDVDVEYIEGSIRKETSFHIDVYALAEYELVTTAPTSWSGNYIIVSTNNSNELLAMNGALSIIDVENNYEVVTEKTTNVIEAGQELEWTISATQTGYSIQGKSGKYIGSLTTDKNGINNSDAEMENTLSIDDSGNVSIAGANGNTLKYNSAANKFRYYTSSSTADTSTVKLYKLKESNNSDSFAQTFLSAFTCDGSGISKPSFALQSDGVTSWSWALLEAEYNKLTNVEKEQFRIGVADENGTNIQQAIARYDYIVGKYFKTGLDTSFTDFMNRDPVSISSSRVNVLSSIINNDDSMISIVVIISLLSIIGVSSYFFIRRRKEQ